jgi:hypothetical protein
MLFGDFTKGKVLTVRSSEFRISKPMNRLEQRTTGRQKLPLKTGTEDQPPIDIDHERPTSSAHHWRIVLKTLEAIEE